MRRNAGKRCWCSALLLHCISSIVHSEGQISGYHFCYLCIHFGNRIRALHAKKTHGPDRIPVPRHRNQSLLRVCIIVCHRIISVIFRDKIPVKESLLHRFAEGFPLILLILRPGRRISFGITTRPRSSILRTIPVAFIDFLLIRVNMMW